MDFRTWRRSRPFWGGLFSMLAGTEILLIPFALARAPLAIVIQQGAGGVSSLLIGFLMILMGLVMWFQPHLHGVAGVATLLFALTSFVASNFGGLLLGMLFGILGGALGFAWSPDPEYANQQSPDQQSPDQQPPDQPR